MNLEDYFDFEKFPTCNRIRLKGTRIAIEHILDPYLQGDSPERIFQNYRRVLTLEQVHAVITYYLHNKAEVDAYLEQSRRADEAAYQDHLKNESPEVVKRLRGLSAPTKPGAES
jgi:uncharacterized protein (DUF433 family)